MTAEHNLFAQDLSLENLPLIKSPVRKKSSVMDEIFNYDMYEAVNEVENDNFEVKVMKELNNYRELSRTSPSEDPLKFWKKLSDDLPL